MNHHGLFVKLMDKGNPNNLLVVLDDWFQAPRVNVNCSNITTADGHELTWCNELRYLCFSDCF